MSTAEDWIKSNPMLRDRTHKWQAYFLKMCLVNASMSKDPDTRVGAVVVGPDMEIRATGFNGFPRGIHDLQSRFHHREDKLKLMVHAEMNCMMNAARIGTSMRGCTLFLACTDDSGEIWGGPPCVRCTVHIIQAGIIQVVAPPQKQVSKWKDELDHARQLLEEAGVTLLETWVLNPEDEPKPDPSDEIPF